jgi:DNA-binding response OmpR family regulator
VKKDMHIALVEDNRFHALLFEQAVREKYPDFAISVYPTGKALLHDCDLRAFDLVAVDYHLPDMDGLELLSIMRGQYPDMPIIMITGVGSEQTAVEAMKSGATDYVAKNGDYGTTIPRVIKQAYHKQQLIQKNRRLEAKARDAEKLEMITTMTSTLNHEVNNPLMAILGNVELLLDDSRITDHGFIEKLRMIEASARRIQAITHRMANLINPVVRQTPVGPMLRLRRRGEDRIEFEETTAPGVRDKSD